MNAPPPVPPADGLRVLLFGHDGQLGTALRRTAPSGLEWVAPDWREADFTDPEGLRGWFRERPDVVVNAAAYTDVDRAEDEEDVARLVNAEAPRVLAEEAARCGAALVHVSTDYVFPGEGDRPLREDDPTGPLGAYGRTKLAGERAVLESDARAVVLRTSWLYSPHGRNFVKTMLAAGRERPELAVVADQWGCPTAADDLARAVWTVVARGLEPAGLFHFAGAGATTWHAFAEAVFEEARRLGHVLAVERVRPIATEEWPTPARRPRWSVLDCSRIREAHGIEPPPWRDSLRRVVGELLTQATPC